MKARLLSHLEERTHVQAALRRLFDEQIEGGPSWGRVFGAALGIFFVLEALTGTLLMLTYTPSVEDAWSSVFFIQDRLALGWFLRGLHANLANGMLLLVGAHLFQVVVYGAYRRPREGAWWIGLALAGLVTGMVITGYRLPWDQRTYWALKVEVNITQSMPVVGDAMTRLLLGGAEIGQQTLTRLYALHVVVLPFLILALIGAKRALVRLHGRTPNPGREGGVRAPWFPGQVARNVAFATVAVLAAAALAVVTHGEALDAPAEPDRFYPARPEWFLLPLYKLRMLVPPDMEVAVTAVLPALMGGVLVMLPFVGLANRPTWRGRLPVIAAVALGGLGAVALTGWTMVADAGDKKHQAELKEAHRRAQRSMALARLGVPPDGPVAMLMNDPLTRGRDVYRQYCTGCHILDGEGKRKSPDHDGFASRSWIVDMLKKPADDRFFGKVKHEELMPSQSKLGDEALWAVAEFLVAEGREAQDPPVDPVLVGKGEDVFRKKCMSCHVFREEGDDLGTGGPNLTGWGSRTWMARQVRDPGAVEAYGDLHKMPTFADQLSEHDIWMVSGFLRQERFRAPSVR